MGNEMKSAIDTTPNIDVLIHYITQITWTTATTPPEIALRGPGDKVLLVHSGTGSGKSTLIPPYLYRAYSKPNIIITEPTRVITADIPYQILQYNDFLKMGHNIGFQTASTAWKPTRGILFSTYGILLQYLKTMSAADFMHKYSFVIIDEVHKRTLEIDNCLYLLKKLFAEHWEDPSCPLLILMSATFNPKPFMDFFNCNRDRFIRVTGESYPIEKHYTPFDMSNYVEYTVDLIERIHTNNSSDITNGSTFRDIIVFVQGRKQIVELETRIHVLNSQVFALGLDSARAHSDKQWRKYTGGDEKEDAQYLVPVMMMSETIEEGGLTYRTLFSDIASVTVDIHEIKGAELGRVLRTVPGGRRVIIATNAAETGLTIDTLRYCIDTGFAKESIYNPIYNCALLIDKNITAASHQQRIGRVGRKDSGVAFGTFTEAVRNDLPTLPCAEIIKGDIAYFVLNTILMASNSAVVDTQLDDLTPASFQMNQFDQQWSTLISQPTSDSRANVFHASELDFLQFPSADSFGASIEKLFGLGFITHEYRVTLFGFYASKFRKVKLESVRMIMAGYHHKANVLDLITIAAFLEVGSFGLGINMRKYEPQNPLGVSTTLAYYYYRLLFADEFIEYLFIWHSFMSVIGKTTKRRDALNVWAKKNGIRLVGMFYVIARRDEIIADMLAMGLNPYYNGLEMSPGSYDLVSILRRNLTEGMGEVRAIKHCIYDGYRFNLCTWNKKLHSYVNVDRHYKVETISKLQIPIGADATDTVEQRRPHYIIVSDVLLRESLSKPGMYVFTAGSVSVLDGFVNVDLSFLQN